MIITVQGMYLPGYSLPISIASIDGHKNLADQSYKGRSACNFQMHNIKQLNVASWKEPAEPKHPRT